MLPKKEQKKTVRFHLPTNARAINDFSLKKSVKLRKESEK